MPTEYGFERYLNVRSAYGASFASDGTRLSFLTDITGVAEVWSVPVDVDAPLPTWPTQLTFRGERTMEASFSPTEDSLLLTGDVGGNDPRVPVGEAEQIVAALTSRGVPVEYMRFDDEGHGLVKRANRLVAYPAIARFLNRFLFLISSH